MGGLSDNNLTASSAKCFRFRDAARRPSIAARRRLARILGNSERLGEAHLRGARPKRLLLALVRRPSQEPDDLEGGGKASVRLGEALGVDFGGAQQGRAAQRRLLAGDERIGQAHMAQVAQERERIAVAHADDLRIGYRQGKPRPLQQPAEIPHIRERRHAGADAAFEFRLGLGE